jgi:hypothetical protein
VRFAGNIEEQVLLLHNKAMKKEMPQPAPEQVDEEME